MKTKEILKQKYIIILIILLLIIVLAFIIKSKNKSPYTFNSDTIGQTISENKYANFEKKQNSQT